jgi:hypothetical protein
MLILLLALCYADIFVKLPDSTSLMTLLLWLWLSYLF